MSVKRKGPASAGVEAGGASSAQADTASAVRDDAGTVLSTNQGVAIATNQHSLRGGSRGPTLLEDFVLREKITHFDHERIPERIVHARGSAAHGTFTPYKDWSKLTRAAFLRSPAVATPVFVRFSTVAGGAGSSDTARDVRGFAVKFYTSEGNYDLVGNNIPVFFIQDAMKFPDLVHAVKPEPHHGMPQAASAHDTFWDFVSLMPESTHMLMWVMSDRAIPRSLRMMQGFGVHTFRFVNEKGLSHFVKFHWTPKLGTHSLVWDEAVKLYGADPDFHRRDLWNAIENGAFPEWELGAQIFTEDEADVFSFDVLDATKLIPEELVPVTPLGRMVLDRNPENFFAQTEQVAFHPGHLVPGIDFSNDPLLQGRLFSYLDTQLIRLGGPNFHEIPINRAQCPVHNNQRDGHMRQTVVSGRVSYEPNSLGGGCPMQAGSAGFVSVPENLAGHKIRERDERFFDFFSQAALFWASQSAIEKDHIVEAFVFELTKVQTIDVRKRVVALLANVADELATGVASQLGIAPLAALETEHRPPKVAPEVTNSPALSMMFRPGDGGIRTRAIAVLVADGTDVKDAFAWRTRLETEGATVTFVGPRLGAVEAAGKQRLEVEQTFATAPAVTFDACVLAAGSSTALRPLAAANQFLQDIYRHGKTLATVDNCAPWLDAMGIDPDHTAGSGAGIFIAEGDRQSASLVDSFVRAVAGHRHWDRPVRTLRV